MLTLLRENPLLLLFVVLTLGYALGRVRVAGTSLGVAAVLFVGLAFGAFDPQLQIPSIVFTLGLTIFVYTIGLANGPSFFRAFQAEGSLQLRFLLVYLTLPLLATIGLHYLFGLEATATAGIYAGVANNSAALAGILDTINQVAPAGDLDRAIAAAVIGFSISYPVAVLGKIVVIALLQRLWRIDYAAEAYALRNQYPIAQEIVNRSIVVSAPEMLDVPLRELQRRHRWPVVFGRLLRGSETLLVTGATRFAPGDEVVIAGEPEAADRVVAALGTLSDDDLIEDRSVFVVRRVFVSNPTVAGQRVAALDLYDRFGATVTRVRRGDVDLLASRDMVLELGDRVRVVVPREYVDEVSAYFGDSYAEVSQINLLSFGLGLTAGLLLGTLTLALPGDISFQIGFAAGPLIVALVLGALRRTGPIVWTLPYSANQTLRQIGLIFLLAGVGVSAGNTLVNTLTGSQALMMLATALILAVGGMALSLFIGYKLFKIPFSLVVGMTAFQPAVLAYATEQARNQLPNAGYALAFPIDIIAKVAVAQIMVAALS